MQVHTHTIRALHYGGIDFLGAFRTDETVVVGCPIGLTPEHLRSVFGNDILNVRQLGRSLVATFAGSHALPAQSVETDLLQGKNVLVAIRNGETAASAVDWLAYHKGQHGAEAALIFDRDPPDQRVFAKELASLAPPLPVIAVSAESPFGLPDAPDARDPALAPAAPKGNAPGIDPWHAPLGQMALFELLRHGFLNKACAVAFLDIADLVLPGPSIFEAAAKTPGHQVPLQGVETYPWRLRQHRPAPHSDHIARRQGENRVLLSWAASPQSLPPDVPWRPGRLRDVPVAKPVQHFRRALGVVFPGVPVKKLIRKQTLREDARLLEHMKQAFNANPVRLPKRDAIAPRPDTNKVTVVTAMKNEGPFVLDWIAHNRAIGVDMHLVYTNDCADGTDHLLDLLADAGVTRRDNPYRATGNVPQHAAFRAAETEQVVTDADWLLTLDVDEYINIHVGNCQVADLLAAQPDAHVISMPWRLFGNSDIEAFDDRPVSEQFTQCAPAFAPRPLQAWAFKSLFRNAGLFRRLGVHRPKGVEAAYHAHLNWVDGSGRAFSPAVWRSAWRMSKAHWGYDLVTLNHYAVRSAESFLVKRDRGRANHTARDQGEAYWFRMNHNAVKDTSIQRLSKRTAREKAALLALPGVAEAHARAVDWHRAQIKRLRSDQGQASLLASITSPRMKNLSRMATYFGSNVYLAGPHVIPDEIAFRDPSMPFYFTVRSPD